MAIVNGSIGPNLSEAGQKNVSNTDITHNLSYVK